MGTDVVVFDIETVPDQRAYRQLLDAPEETSASMLRAAWVERGYPFKPALEAVVAIACAVIDADGRFAGVASLGDLASREADLVRSFFQVVAARRPRLVGWNSSGFDLPVLITRALVHRISAPVFYHWGQPYHGYLRRYDDEGHVDLMDQLSLYRATTPLKLHEAAALFGIPGKLGTEGDDVLRLYEDGELSAIRQYCESDVLTTALIYGRYALHRGWWDPDQGPRFEASIQAFLADSQKPHHRRFLEAWAETAGRDAPAV